MSDDGTAEIEDGTVEDERRLAFAVALAAMLIPLNSTMLVVALPSMLSDLDAGLSAGGWLVTSYLITMASLQPVTGKLGDRLGPRRVLLTGLIGFAACSLGAGLAPNVGVLMLFRAGQGIAGAMVMPNGQAVLRRVVPQFRLGARMGIVSSTITAGAAVGPVAGGFLVALAGWRSVFLVNLPLVALILVLAQRTVPHLEPAPVKGSFDIGGAAGLLAVLGGGALLLTRARGVAPAQTVAAAAVLVVVGLVFLRHERRHADPVVHTRLFRRQPFVAGAGGIALGNLAMYVALLAVPVLLARREQWSSGQVGLALASLSFGSLFLSPFGGRVADRIGPRIPSAAGMAVAAIGMAMLAFGARGPMLMVAMAVAGIGFGFSFSGFQLAAISSAEPAIAGAASGVISTCRYAGSITGTSLLAGPLAPAGVRGFTAVFVMTTAGAAAATILALFLPTSIGARARARAESSVGTTIE